MNRDNPSQTPSNQPRLGRVGRWTLAGVALAACVVVLIVVLQQRVQQSAREHAKSDALRALEQAQRDGKKAQQELKKALRAMEQERQRYADAGASQKHGPGDESSKTADRPAATGGPKTPAAPAGPKTLESPKQAPEGD